MVARFLEGVAFGVLNDIFAAFRSDEGGYASPNRFEVVIIPPSSRSGLPIDTPFIDPNTAPAISGFRDGVMSTRNVSLRCDSITLPGRNLATIEDANLYGPTRQVVNRIDYAETVNCTFLADSELRERVFFETWQEKAFNRVSYDLGYYDDYTSTVEIYLLDRQNKRRFGLKLNEAFPKTIGPTELSNASSNEIIRIPVEFSFRWWETLDQNRELRPSNPIERIASNLRTPQNIPAVALLNRL